MDLPQLWKGAGEMSYEQAFIILCAVLLGWMLAVVSNIVNKRK